MRVGRILRSGDILFGDSEKPASVSAGGVVLLRRGDDDYVRFRVPDTQCPPLPLPSTPLDSGVADEAEPNRWNIYGQPDTQNKWKLLESRDKIELNYTVYPGDFVIEVVSSYISKTGTNTGSPGYLTFDGICLTFTVGNYVYGIGVGWAVHHGVVEVPWGGSEGRAIWWFIATTNGGKLATGGYMIPASQTDVRYRVQRSGSQLRFGWLNSNGQWNYSNYMSVGSGEISVTFEGVRITDGGPEV